MPARFRFLPRVVPLEGPLAALDGAGALERLGHHRLPVLLDSAGGEPSRFDLLGFDPLPVPAPASLAALRGFLAQLEPVAGDSLPGIFAGGFLGALAYELGPCEEQLSLPRDPWGWPGIVGGLYVDFLVRDRAQGTAHLVLGEDPGDGRAPWEARRDTLLAELGAPAPVRTLVAAGPLIHHVAGLEHRARIETARREIAAGEIYQANLAQRFTREVQGDPIALYRTLRRLHPAPYMGFLRWEEGAILSASPELLLDYADDEDGPLARTRPIKGTIERGADEEADRKNAARLLASEKDLAELAMIVDLERNDLGRVARPGGVRVDAFPSLETYATVHHLVAEVSARPASGVDALDVLTSLFPGGSITGAPKLRSMEIIAALEGEGRGLSFGALGSLDLSGRACFNLLIRTPLWRPRPERGPAAGDVTYRVGGGITWASDPRAEELESLVKGEALAQALEEGSPPGG